jgi:hypothetical protein
MRIVFNNGKQVGTDPINHYVYLWRHGEIDCYVGKGVNGRWKSHTRPNSHNPNDRNEPKPRYFLAHLSEMTCYITAEALRTGEANERETVEIRRRGYTADRTGTLLNAKRDASIARAARKPAGSRKKHLRQKRLAGENACAKARARGLSQPEIASASAGMLADSRRGKIARALYYGPRPGLRGITVGITVTLYQIPDYGDTLPNPQFRLLNRESLAKASRSRGRRGRPRSATEAARAEAKCPGRAARARKRD